MAGLLITGFAILVVIGLLQMMAMALSMIAFFAAVCFYAGGYGLYGTICLVLCGIFAAMDNSDVYRVQKW